MAESQPTTPAPSTPPQQPTDLPPAQRAPDGGPVVVDIDERRLMAALSYAAVLVFVPLLTSRDDAFVRFHAKQGLVLLGGLVLALLAAAWIPAVGTILFVAVMLLDLAGLVQALVGRQWKIPGVYQVSALFQI